MSKGKKTEIKQNQKHTMVDKGQDRPWFNFLLAQLPRVVESLTTAVGKVAAVTCRNKRRDVYDE